jgi:hypothetical protein
MSGNEPQISQLTGSNPEDLSRLLEIELIQKRAEWQRTTARHKNLKMFSLLFLFMVVLAGLVAFYFAYMRASEERNQRPPAAAATVTP